MAKLSAKNPVTTKDKKQKEIINKSKVEKPNKVKKAVKTDNEKVVTAKPVQNKENDSNSATTYSKRHSVQANIPDEEFKKKYPVFKNVALVNKFLSLQLTNNQKGRLRQEVRETLKGTSPQIQPDVIYDMVKAIGNGTDEYTEGQLRRIRILYNMLRTAIQNKNNPEKVEINKAKGKENGVGKENGDTKKVGKKNKKLNGVSVEDNAEIKKVDNKNKKLKGKENVVNDEESGDIKKVGKKHKLNAVGDEKSGKNKKENKSKKLKVEENIDSDEENEDSDEENEDSDEENEDSDEENEDSDEDNEDSDEDNEDSDEENEESGEEDEEMDTVDDEELSPKPVKKGKNTNTKVEEKKGKDVKVKGPKRYVVFVGNLPLDTDKEKIMKHFSNLKDQIVDIRVPPPAEGKKSTIAYVELKNSTSYELALSKHHSMMSNRRINVMFTAQKNSKLSNAEVKGKAAKLVALQTSGKLTGSAPLVKKRSQRRKKARLAQKKLENNE